MFNYVFPIETINRELDAKVMVAVNVVDKKSRVYLGQHDYLHRVVAHMRHGVYFGKNFFRGNREDSAEVVEQLKHSDLRLFYLHEEGAIFAAGGDAWKPDVDRQYDPRILHDDDLVFLWGATQAEYDRQRLANRRISVEATGHPRFDLYKEQYRSYFRDKVAELRSRFGPYVLLNTNFSVINAATSWDISINRFGERRFIKEGLLFFRFLELISTLARDFPDTRFLVRSHPSEHDQAYIQLFRAYPNIVVRHEGPVAPWIFGAQCLIHSGCTTAVEAWFAGVPSIDYPAVSDSPLTMETSRRCTQPDQVVHELRKVLASPEDVQLTVPSEVSRGLLQNIDADALARLTEHLRNANDGSGQGVSNAELSTIYRQYWLRDRAAHVKARFSSRSRARRVYDSKKFQGFERSTVDTAVRDANRVLGRQAVVEYFDPMLVVLGVDR